jgi:hypothetical protein
VHSVAASVDEITSGAREAGEGLQGEADLRRTAGNTLGRSSLPTVCFSFNTALGLTCCRRRSAFSSSCWRSRQRA